MDGPDPRLVSRPFIEDEIGSYYGAGLVVDAKRGWILTNAHVASHSYATLGVAFADGAPTRAERVYVDPHLDLAVVAYDPKALAKQPALPSSIARPCRPWGIRSERSGIPGDSASPVRAASPRP